MRYRIFLDTNILISGIFFKGNESKILDMPEVDLITCEDVVYELKNVMKKKLKYLDQRNLEIALVEVDRALSDIGILPREKYLEKSLEAEALIAHKKDIPILAAARYSNADYLLTGDSHFFTDKVKSELKVRKAREFLDEIEKA
ncbi:MAG: PIN domain-containing protein [Deltaproteobacteria bacterium]|nr:PIN domain-containing protein [Deltaproteobacteria bacterium]